ncbi:hypothetical protein AK812_SmicGene42770 [Symbiodinium microadriaticum]|uniref:Uncharacterized protein n=1 Tax=Symbiodinium microadriaticum TaxID=2951 RepID=A0A1Q9C2Q4_SYMMI|nr:hypothetical protein AK812_SmicGene42770 [Symbiodinium microadriaticum]
MLFGSQPGVDVRIAALQSFPDETDLSWPSTYHSYQPHLGFRQSYGYGSFSDAANMLPGKLPRRWHGG